MSHKHITINERNKIEVLNKEGYTGRKIANILKYNNSSISRELKRCEGQYSAVEAQKDYDDKSKNKGRKVKLT